MRRFVEIAWTGVDAARLHPARSVATVAAVLAGLLPYLIGLALSRGVRDAAADAVRDGADLYVTGEQFGRPVPIPTSAATRVGQIPSVERVVPRIVGRIELGKERVSAVVVGVPPEEWPAALQCVEGRLYTGGPRNELVIGSDLARRLNLTVGSLLPPFYHSREGERVSEVVGLFRSDTSPWAARVVFTSFETAARIFDQPGLATDLLVHCRSGYETEVARIIQRDGFGESAPHPRVVTRTEAAVLLDEGPRRREGVFTLLFALAIAVSVLVVLVTSGFGLAGRRRELGILKATGWQTDELIFRSLVESLLLAGLAAALAVIIAAIWLKGCNGYWIASIFLAGVEPESGFRIPSRLTPLPALLATLIAMVVVATGSLYATWRAATAPPFEAMR
jgi:ABC-type lipoprotein release transport system permease subunit